MSTPETTRPATPADAVDGVIPARASQPESPEALARALAHAAAERQVTVLRGGGTKLGWGRTPRGVDHLLDTRRLDKLIAHRHGDMTATAQAGMPLLALNRRLAEHGQYLPVDSAFDAATLGGIIATNDTGPLRHRFGTPRDLLIGITLAMTDGRIVKAGGTVVKNVAGYDLGKLVSGSHGSLAAIVDLTFKLLPIPRASTTLVATYANADGLSQDVATLSASQLELTSFDLRVSDHSGFQLLMRMASSPVATEALAVAVARQLSRPSTTLTGEAEQALWTEQVRLPWAGQDTTVVRLSWMPASLPGVLALIARLQARGCRPVLIARASGAGLLRLHGDVATCLEAIADLRASPEVGHVVILRGSSHLKARIDVWGAPTGSAGVAHSLKRMFDPAGILNAGRGPI